MYSYDDITALWIDYCTYYISWFVYYSCLVSMSLDMRDDFNWLSTLNLPAIILYTSTINYLSLSLRFFYNCPLKAATSPSTTFNFKLWIFWTSSLNLAASSSFIWAMMVVLSCSYFYFYMVYFSTLFYILLSYNLLHRIYYYSVFRFYLYSFTSIFNFLHWPSSKSIYCSLIDNYLFKLYSFYI